MITGFNSTIKNFLKDNVTLKDTLLQVAVALSRAQELKDPYTAGHGVRVARIAKKIASVMGWEEQQVFIIEFAGLLHDIGKMGIPSDILMKPGRLNKIEMKLVMEHPEKGYDVLKDLQFPFPIAEIIYQHHEKIDGTGYPRGLKGNKIIPESRILAVADIVEALTVSRPYRPELSLYNVIDIIRFEAGRTLDAEVVDILIELIKKTGDKFWA